MRFRIGHGYDVHRFTDGDHIIIGGVKIAHDRALLAHSDGDVLLHAVCDALLGAAALPDIGQQFPDSNATYKNADSRELLRQVVALLKSQNYRVANLDSTLVAQAPKMAAHRQAMREHLAADLELGLDQVNVKATTTEGLGFPGRREGIAAYAVVIIESVKDE